MRDSVYWVSMKTDIEDLKKLLNMPWFSTGTAIGQNHPSQNTKLPWKVIDTDLGTLNSSSFLWVVGFHIKLPTINWAIKLWVESLTACCKIILQNMVYPKIILEMGTNFVWGKSSGIRKKTNYWRSHIIIPQSAKQQPGRDVHKLFCWEQRKNGFILILN